MASCIDNLAICARRIQYDRVHDVGFHPSVPRSKRKTLNIFKRYCLYLVFFFLYQDSPIQYIFGCP